MRDLFNRDNWYTRFMEKLFNICLLNVLFFVTCLPVVTIGASITAMYSVLVKICNDRESGIVKLYFKELRRGFVYGTKQFFFPLLILALMIFDIGYWAGSSSGISPLGYIATAAMIMLWCCWMMWLCPLSVTFDNTVRNTMINAGKFALSFLPLTFIISAASLAIFVVLIASPGLMPLLAIGAFTGIAYGQCMYVDHALKKYMKEHPDLYDIQVTDK